MEGGKRRLLEERERACLVVSLPRSLATGPLISFLAGQQRLRQRWKLNMRQATVQLDHAGTHIAALGLERGWPCADFCLALIWPEVVIEHEHSYARCTTCTLKLCHCTKTPPSAWRLLPMELLQKLRRAQLLVKGPNRLSTAHTRRHNNTVDSASGQSFFKQVYPRI